VTSCFGAFEDKQVSARANGSPILVYLVWKALEAFIIEMWNGGVEVEEEKQYTPYADVSEAAEPGV
jgi:hypothetical protein